MKRLALLSLILALFVAGNADAWPRRYVVYPTPVYRYYPRPRVIVATPLVISNPPASSAPALPLYISSIPLGDSSAAVSQMERLVRIKNDTGEKLTVSMVCRTRDEKGRWVWLPDEPDAGDRVMTFSLSSGQVMDFGGKTTANRIRIWASSPARQWTEYQSKDLLVVPEPEGRYLSARMETFTYTFSKKSTEDSR